MIETLLPQAHVLRVPVSAPVSGLHLEQLATLRLENAAFRAQNAALQEHRRQLEARLRQNSSNSSRPPCTDPPQAPPAGWRWRLWFRS